MDADQPQHQPPDTPPDHCPLCGRPAPGVCSPCVEAELRRRLPDLMSTLERRYGPALDRWLAAGRFKSASWEVHPKFTVGRIRLRRFLASVLSDAFRRHALLLSLPGLSYWEPSAAEELAASVYERCGEALREEITQRVAEALRHSPTEAAERELIEVACGRRGADLERRDSAVEAAAYTPALPLGWREAALLDLRYSGSLGREMYTEIDEGKIDRVWREVVELLPPEVAALIPQEEGPADG